MANSARPEADDVVGKVGYMVLSESIEANLRRLSRDEGEALLRFAEMDRKIREEAIQTRTLIGERELRFDDFVRQVRDLARAFADGLDALAREW